MCVSVSERSYCMSCPAPCEKCSIGSGSCKHFLFVFALGFLLVRCTPSRLVSMCRKKEGRKKAMEAQRQKRRQATAHFFYLWRESRIEFVSAWLAGDTGELNWSYDTSPGMAWRSCTASALSTSLHAWALTSRETREKLATATATATAKMLTGRPAPPYGHCSSYMHMASSWRACLWYGTVRCSTHTDTGNIYSVYACKKVSVRVSGRVLT